MERVLTLKANYFAEVLNYDICIIVTEGKGKSPFFPLSPKIKIINLDIRFDEMLGKSLAEKAFVYIRKQLQYKKKLKKLLYELRPDITVSMLRREIIFLPYLQDGSVKLGEYHWSRTNIYNTFSGEMNILKKIISVLWRKQLIAALKRLDKFIVLTYEDAKQWPEIKNTIVIHNPLSFWPEAISPCSSKEVIAAGRYVPQKGFDLLIDAWKRVAAIHPEWSLRIYGAGVKKALQAQIEREGLAASCFLEGAVPDLENKFLQSSIFVLSSRFEGFALVLMEAMCCGVPPVSFDCPCGPREIIRDGIDGLLVEPGNVLSLASKICYLIDNESIRKDMGRMARKNVQRFNIENIGRQWQGLFESLTCENKTKTKFRSTFNIKIDEKAAIEQQV
jgi:glycosyltransferase involved in cell wall biosynthesis